MIAQTVSFAPATPDPLVCPDCVRFGQRHLVHMYNLMPLLPTTDGLTAIAMGLCRIKARWIIRTEEGYRGGGDFNRLTDVTEDLGDGDEDVDSVDPSEDE